MYLIVAGSGKTSRANTEALLKDYFDKVGLDNVHLVLPYVTDPDVVQTQALQLILDLTEEPAVTTFSSEADDMYGEFVSSESPYLDAANFAKANAVALIAPNDDDPKTLDILWACKKHNITVLDISNGLLEVFVSENAAPSEVMSAPEEELDTPEDDDEEETAESKEAEILYALDVLADYLANAVVNKLLYRALGGKE